MLMPGVLCPMDRALLICIRVRPSTCTNPQGREAGRPSPGTTHQVRAGHQPQDREGARPDDPAVPPAASGPGDRVMDRRRLLLTSLAGAGFLPLAPVSQQG